MFSPLATCLVDSTLVELDTGVNLKGYCLLPVYSAATILSSAYIKKPLFIGKQNLILPRKPSGVPLPAPVTREGVKSRGLTKELQAIVLFESHNIFSPC